MPSVILMENAGRNAANIIADHYSDLPEKRVAVFCGPGNNGGDGFVIARHLHNAGWQVRTLLTCEPAKLKGDALINYRIVDKMPVPIETVSSIDDVLTWAELIVDALLGTGFAGEVREPLASLINRLNQSGKPIVAVDLPSGLDCQTAKPAASTVRASHTITFVAAKTGLLTATARDYVGKIIVADIGVPRELIQQVAGRQTR